jgi:hypothetical protein
MTRKDSEAIAGAIAQARHDTEPLVYAALLIADYLETTNPRFDRVRFLKACRVSE